MINKHFANLFFAFVMSSSSLLAMDSLNNDITAKEVKNIRQAYTSAAENLLEQVKVRYENDSLYLFDKINKILTIHKLNHNGKNESTIINFPQYITSVYPSKHKEWFLVKTGPKEQQTLGIFNLENNTLTELKTKYHKTHKLFPIQQISSAHLPEEDRVYFFQAVAVNKKEEYCGIDDENKKREYTLLFSFIFNKNIVQVVDSLPVFCEAVYRETDRSYILREEGEMGRKAKFSKISPSFTKCIPFLTIKEGICNYELQDKSFFFSKYYVAFLSSKKNKKKVFTPFLYKEEKSDPLLTEEERNTLNADITTFIPDFQGKLIAYGEDGLRLDWKTPQDVKEEYGSLSILLNALQKDRECNLYYIEGFPEKHMIFKEVGPNGSYRFLVINEKDKIKEGAKQFAYQWIDLRDEFKNIAFLPEIICNVPIISTTYQSRDKASIPVYLVRPFKCTTATPGLVDIHGGPQSRNQWNHTLNDARYFALLGYTSIFPQFRGSQGFGEEHFKGGYRKHMTTVSEDIVDAALWAEKEGYIIRDKTVLMGNSYGAFMVPIVLAKTKEFPFLGGIAVAGFYDVVKSLETDSNKHNIEFIAKDQGWGDLKCIKDREEMHNSSPVTFASKIQVPLLLMHGTHDNNCPYEQAELMASALKKENKSYAFVELKKAGHTLQWETYPYYLAGIEHFLHKVTGGAFEPLNSEEKKSKSKILKIVTDTTGFFKDFK